MHSQFWMVLATSLLGIRGRLGICSGIVIGTAGVVAVTLSLFAMVSGIRDTMINTGREDRIIVLRSGASSEVTSSLRIDAVNAVRDLPSIKRDQQGAAIISAEVLTIAPFRRSNGTDTFVPVRGVAQGFATLRPELRVVDGRRLNPGVGEAIVGRAIHGRVSGLTIGSRFSLRGVSWRVVGVFASNDAHESEIIVDVDELQAALGRQGRYQSITAMLATSSQLREVKDALSLNPSLTVDVLREPDYFREQSVAVSKLAATLVAVVGTVMAIGAVLASLNTMYSTVRKRTVEIATLRAIGFRERLIVLAILAEAGALAVLGGAVGAVLSWLVIDGYSHETSAGAGALESYVYTANVDVGVASIAVLLSCAVGTVGGLFPAIRAARMPIALGLRAV